ncbi:MAG: histidine kinase [Bacteroidales bacterium]|nr:histidine kinase [Bacteroidales bacterium]MCM1147783.1 histidine kinase [Bacteroidales bacterium]MCM1206607.1 histidine kinase [Bacillota bacterium]MCM1510652.1 histidine kinase [Clostridium sp.]
MKNILHKKAAFYAFAVISIISCSRGNSRQDTDRVSVLLDSVETLSGMSLNAQTLPLLDSALTYSEGNDTLQAYIYAEKANNLLTMGRMAEALPLSRQAIALGEKLGDNEILVNQYSAIGITYRRLNLPDSAMWAYRKGIDVARKVDAKDYVANLYNNISVIFTEQDRYKEGVEYADLATKWAREAKDSVELYSALATKSAALFRMKRYRESIAAVAAEFPDILALGYVPLTLKCASPMLHSLVESGNIARAQEYMRQIQPALQAADPASNGVIGIMEIKAALLHSQKEYREELAVWNRLDTLVLTNGGIPRERILFAKADCYGKLGEPQRALSLMSEAYNLADSLKNSGMSRQMTEFTIKYKTQEKELMIAQLDAERANQQSLIAILLLILALLAVIVFFVLYRRRITRKENELALQRRFIEGLESERARLARELHDGVCNDLLGVQLALNSGKDNASQMVRHIMTDVRQISHELMPPRFNMANVAQILSDYIGHLPLPDCEVEFRCTPSQDDAQWNEVNTSVSFDIYRIVQELTGNIVRHAKPSFIHVNMEHRDGHIYLSVENDGAVSGNDGQGIGMQSISVRVKSLNGEICHTESNDGRYRVEVTL